MKTNNGFTLMELMIVVAVISILAAIALPNYNAYVVRGKLAEASSTLSDGRVKMEQFFLDNRKYDGGPTPAATTYFTYVPTFSASPSMTYTITANGTGSMLGWAYTIDQNNARTTTAAPAGWATATMPGTPATCWITRKGGVC